jgi:ribosomal protein S27AE
MKPEFVFKRILAAKYAKVAKKSFFSDLTFCKLCSPGAFVALSEHVLRGKK